MNQIPLYARVTLWVSVPILVTTAVLKAVTAWDTSRGLPNEDPVFSGSSLFPVESGGA